MSLFPRGAFAACLLLLTIVPAAPAAQAQVRRCTTSEGIDVFTDRRCADLGATERLPREAGATGALRVRRGGCSRAALNRKRIQRRLSSTFRVGFDRLSV